MVSLRLVLGQGKTDAVGGGGGNQLTYQELSATCGANYCPAAVAGKNAMEGDHGQKKT